MKLIFNLYSIQSFYTIYKPILKLIVMSKVEDKTVDTIGTVTVCSTKLQKAKKNKKNFSKLTNIRIIQKQLVYVIGLSQDYAFKNVKNI
jgi:hypothetical protein